jgi:hypothetical protein
MKQEGPVLELLLQRMAETPQDFLEEPRIGGHGEIHVDAIVHDVVRRYGPLAGTSLEFLKVQNRSGRNRFSMAALLGWLLADDWFVLQRLDPARLVEAIRAISEELSAHVVAAACVSEPERREEIVRLVLARFGFRPAGETLEQSQDRLTTISSVERARVIEAARKAQERSRAIREALAKKAAHEAADKWGRE